MKKIVWVTGSSSGIGKAVAQEYNQQGYFVILSSRQEEGLKQTQSELVHPEDSEIITLDLGDLESIKTAVDQFLNKYQSLFLLVNNGGISQRDLAANTSIDVDKKLMDVNYLGTVYLTKLLLPLLLKQEEFKIAVITSLVGIIGTPYRSGYAASKHALHGYFDSLRAEIQHNNYSITIVCPGFIKTNVSINAIMGDGNNCGEMDQAQEEGMLPEQFARKLAKAIQANKEEVYIGGREILGVYLKRFVPGIFSKLIRSAKVR